MCFIEEEQLEYILDSIPNKGVDIEYRSKNAVKILWTGNTANRFTLVVYAVV